MRLFEASDRPHYWQMAHGDWRAKCLYLPLEAEAVLLRIINHMWDTGQCVPNTNDGARMINVQVQRFHKIVGFLLERGHLARGQGVVFSPRAMSEIETWNELRKKRAFAATEREFLKKKERERMAREAALGGVPMGNPRGSLGGSIDGEEKNINIINGREADACFSKSRGLAEATNREHGEKRGATICNVGGVHRGSPEGDSRKLNGINDSGSEVSIYNIEKKEKNSKEEKTPPVVPLAADADAVRSRTDLRPNLDDDLASEIEPGGRGAETRRRRAQEKKELRAAALEKYNAAAAHWGFSRCDVLSDARARRLVQRVEEIGGLERFRQALRAIGSDDFLMGRVPPKPGQAPFRLNIDRLLQTDGGMGDVLARLLETAGDPAEPQSPNGQKWGWWRKDMDALRNMGAEVWRRRLDEVKPNGEWPWWLLGAPPGHDECIVDAEVCAERGLVEIYKGEISHD